MIVRSPLPDVSVPEIPFTEAVLHGAAEWADQPAIVEGPTGRTITYGQLAAGVDRVAANLAKRGFRKGDVMAIFSPNIPEYAIVFLAVARLGGINTTINPLYTVEELAFQLNDAGAKYLITVPPFMEKALEGKQKSGVQELFVFGEAAGATPFAELMQPGGEVPKVEINLREDLVVLPYSSGTTGLPKGVMLTHYNLVANLCQMNAMSMYQPGERVICVLPLFHIYGMMVIMAMGLYTGSTIVTLPRFDLEMFLQVMQDQKVTMAPLVPPIMLGLAKHPIVDQYDLSSLKLILSAAAPLSPELQKQCTERLNCVVVQGWGMTETSPGATMTPPDPARVKIGAVGVALPLVEMKVVDIVSGEELEANQEGEICTRGPHIMKGYLNRPDATANTIDKDGWLHTGDIGYFDSDRYFYIVERLKELIKYKGLQVAPAELEGVLITHPAVADVAVIPVQDEEAGEIPKAYVVLKSGATATPEELMGFVAGKLAPHKKIRRLEFIDQIPKSASGKILRRFLVDRERSAAAKPS